MENSDIIINKNESKSKNLGKFNKKSIYLNTAKYCTFLNYNKINYEIPKWLPLDKIDLQIASNLIDYYLQSQENKKDNSDE